MMGTWCRGTWPGWSADFDRVYRCSARRCSVPSGTGFEVGHRMRRPRERHTRPRWSQASEWAAAPHARVAVETLEERFLLSGDSAAVVRTSVDHDARVESFFATALPIELTALDLAGGSVSSTQG